MGKHQLSQKVLDEIKASKNLNKKCQEALKEVLRNTGYHARVILYPGEADK